jgi:hypothetical protein
MKFIQILQDDLHSSAYSFSANETSFIVGDQRISVRLHFSNKKIFLASNCWFRLIKDLDIQNLYVAVHLTVKMSNQNLTPKTIDKLNIPFSPKNYPLYLRDDDVPLEEGHQYTLVFKDFDPHNRQLPACIIDT